VVLLLAVVSLVSLVAAVVSALVAPPPLVPSLVLVLALEVVPVLVDPALVELVLAVLLLTAVEIEVLVMLGESVATGASSSGGLSHAAEREPKVRSAESCRTRLECIERASHRLTNGTSVYALISNAGGLESPATLLQVENFVRHRHLLLLDTLFEVCCCSGSTPPPYCSR